MFKIFVYFIKQAIENLGLKTTKEGIHARRVVTIFWSLSNIFLFQLILIFYLLLYKDYVHCSGLRVIVSVL